MDTLLDGAKHATLTPGPRWTSVALAALFLSCSAHAQDLNGHAVAGVEPRFETGRVGGDVELIRAHFAALQ